MTSQKDARERDDRRRERARRETRDTVTAMLRVVGCCAGICCALYLLALAVFVVAS